MGVIESGRKVRGLAWTSRRSAAFRVRGHSCPFEKFVVSTTLRFGCGQNDGAVNHESHELSRIRAWAMDESEGKSRDSLGARIRRRRMEPRLANIRVHSSNLPAAVFAALRLWSERREFSLRCVSAVVRMRPVFNPKREAQRRRPKTIGANAHG